MTGWMEGYGIHILKRLMMEGVVLSWIMDFSGIYEMHSRCTSPLVEKKTTTRRESSDETNALLTYLDGTLCDEVSVDHCSAVQS